MRSAHRRRTRQHHPGEDHTPDEAVRTPDHCAWEPSVPLQLHRDPEIAHGYHRRTARAAIKRHSVPASFVVLDVGIGDCEPRMLLEGVLTTGNTFLATTTST